MEAEYFTYTTGFLSIDLGHVKVYKWSNQNNAIWD